ncbi:hypothetical protein [Paraburkholderia nodosa]|uniref:hypothetical protein n=1 Tax=Paraburkholderia nodosa TaxID=392320 RepID=UPI000480EEFC|nr:hypothetical protein [Paraburkholderia nodosa]
MSRYQYVNGLKEANDLTAMSFRNLKLDSLVDQLKIHECHALIGPTDVTSIEPNDVVRVMKSALPR